MKTHLLLFSLLISLTCSSQLRYYPLDGNGIETISGQNGILGGGSTAPTPTTDRNNNPSSALSFDGDDYIIIPTQGITNTPFSICAWVLSYSVPLYPDFRAWYAVGDIVGDQMLGIENNVFGNGYFFNGYRNNTDTFRLETSGATSNTWHFVCGTYGLDYARFYVDGVIIDSTPSNGSPALYGNSPTAFIGSRNIGTNGWIGKIDNVGVYDFAVTPADFTGIQENNLSNAFVLSIYPNPVKNLLTISLNNQTIRSIKITDSLGKRLIVKTIKTLNAEQIITETLASGIYFLDITTNDNLVVKRKFVKY